MVLEDGSMSERKLNRVLGFFFPPLHIWLGKLRAEHLLRLRRLGAEEILGGKFSCVLDILSLR